VTRSRALLIGGYALAVPLLLRFGAVVRNRRVGSLVALEVGQAMVVAAWALRRRRLATAINVAALVGYPAWYLYGGRRESGGPA